MAKKALCILLNIYTVARRQCQNISQKTAVPRGWFAGARLDEKKCETETHLTVAWATPRIGRIAPILRLFGCYRSGLLAGRTGEGTASLVA
jgi:hypothetical protein